MVYTMQLGLPWPIALPDMTAAQQLGRQSEPGLRLTTDSLSNTSARAISSTTMPAKTNWQAQFFQLLQHPKLTDLTIDQNGALWLDHGTGLRFEPWQQQPTPVELTEFAMQLIELGDRHLDVACPVADVVLPLPPGFCATAEVAAKATLGDLAVKIAAPNASGLRVHAVLSEITGAGPVLSIRKPSLLDKTLTGLAQAGLGGDITTLQTAISKQQNILISGPSGVGKTTLLSAIILEMPPGHRVIAVEDLAELRLARANYVQLCARQANNEGAGAISTQQLIIEALRMRPDRLVLGEARGAELISLLTALNTGHSGGALTCHANSLADLPARLEAMGALAGFGTAAVARQVVAAIDLVVQLSRTANGREISGYGKFYISAAGALSIQELSNAN